MQLKELIISSRLGNTLRKITLPNGCVFVTKENDKIDTLLLDNLNKKNILFKLEKSILFVFVSILLVLVIIFAFFKWGLPYMSKQIAYSLPLLANNIIASNTINALDKYVLQKSKLSILKQQTIQKTFINKVLPLMEQNKKLKYKLHFRAWTINNQDIANALALPNGDIILTDKLVELSLNEDELIAVILHEIGHIKKRHTMQMLIQKSFISAFVMFITSDTNILGDLGIGLSTFLLNNNYSRTYELQADDFAFRKMLLAKIDPQNLILIIEKISPKKNIADDKKNKSIMNYFSTHPSTSSRTQLANKYSKCFKNKLSFCKKIQ